MKDNYNDLFYDLVQGYRERVKFRLTPATLEKLKPEEIRAWSWGTGMGSDPCVLLLKTDGTLWRYDHFPYSDDSETFDKIRQLLQQKRDYWFLHRCRFFDNLYIYQEDRGWFDRFWKELPRPQRSPMVCLECICRHIAKDPFAA